MYYLIVLVLSMCAIMPDSRGAFNLKPQFHLTGASKNALYNSKTQHAPRFMADTTEHESQDSSSRAKRFVEQLQGWAERYFQSFTSASQDQTTTSTVPTMEISSSPTKQPVSSVTHSSKDSGRTPQKVPSPNQHTRTRELTDDDDETFTESTVSGSELNHGKTEVSKTRLVHDSSSEDVNSERSEGEISEKTFTKPSKPQNKLPLFDRHSNNRKSENSGNQYYKGLTTVSSIVQPDKVTAYPGDTQNRAGNNITESYHNFTHVTSQPDGNHSLEVKSGDNPAHYVPASPDDNNSSVEKYLPTTTTVSLLSPSVLKRPDDKKRHRKYRHDENEKGTEHKERPSKTADKSDLYKDQNGLESFDAHSKSEQHQSFPQLTSNDSGEENEDSMYQIYSKNIEEKEGVEEEGQENSEEISEDGEYPSKNCPTCGKNGLSEEDVRALRIGMFTDLLAQKLRMDPEDLSVDASDGEESAEQYMPRLPPSVLEQTMKDDSMKDETDDFYARDEETIIKGHDMGKDCINTRATGCYRFNFENEANAEIADAQLWLYKMRDRNDMGGQTMMVYELESSGSGGLRHINLVVREETFIKDGWVSLNVTRSVIRWLQQTRDHVMVALRCKTCATRSHKALFGTKNDFKPLLVIKYASNSLDKRDKRSADDDCDPRTDCCKRPLQVSFHDINMHSILHPPSLSVGYCFGYCGGITQYTYNHTALKQRLRWNVYANDPNMRQQLQPCCVPLVLKDSFIITGGNDYIVRKMLPRVIVERCGCL